MTENDAKSLALQKSRRALDKRGIGNRPQARSGAIEGGNRVSIALTQARAVGRDTGRISTVNWQVYRPSLYLPGAFTIQNGAVAPHRWTTRTWWQRAGESAPSYNSTSTRYKIPIASNPHGGFDWRKNLFVSWGYGPFKFVATSALETTQQVATMLIELLDAAGATLKTVTAISSYGLQAQLTGAPNVPIVDLSSSVASIVYDSSGPVGEFYGIKASYSFSLARDVGDNVTLLKWYEGRVKC